MDAKQALEQLKQAVEKTAQCAQEQIDNGVLLEAVAFHLAAAADKLPGAVKTAQIEAIAERLSDDDLKKLPPDFIERLRAIHQSPSAKPAN